MTRWMERLAGCRTAGLVVAAALVMVSCSAQDESDSDTPVVPEVGLVTEEGSPPERSEDDELAAAARQERIDLMTSDAKQSVVRAANFLAEQIGFRVVADTSFDVRQIDGRLLEFGSRREITVRRPDHLRIASTERDGDRRTLYIDGSTISIDLPGHEAFVREVFAGTYYAAVEKLSWEIDSPVPLANLFSENFAAPLDDQMASGYYIGQEEIGGRLCEHLSFRLPEVDVQLWIEEGDRPLVARVVITHKHEPGNPQYRATLHDWELGLEVPDTIFEFESAKGAERLSVGSLVDEQSPDQAGEVE